MIERLCTQEMGASGNTFVSTQPNARQDYQFVASERDGEGLPGMFLEVIQLELDGSLVIPADLVSRWQIQIETPYEALTERDKDSDRDQVRRYFPLLREVLQDEASA